MGIIYRLAEKYIIWLSPREPGDWELLWRLEKLRRVRAVSVPYKSASFPEYSQYLISKLHNQKLNLFIFNLQILHRTVATAFLATTDSWHTEPGGLYRLGRIYSNERFTRVWTINEFLLARHSSYRIDKGQCSIKAIDSSFHAVKHIIREKTGQIFDTRHNLQLWLCMDPTNAVLILVYNFIQFVLLVAASNARDARDKVHGMAALINHPDYDRVSLWMLTTQCLRRKYTSHFQDV